MSYDIVGFLIGFIFVAALYYWAYRAFRAKSSRLYPVAWLLYAFLFAVVGVGPLPIIFFLYLDFGIDPYFDNRPSHRPVYYDKSP